MLRSLAARSLGAAAAASLSSSSSSSSWRARCDGDPYAALGVAKGASKEEIRRAYKVKAAKAHPDHGGDAEEFKRLAAAYATLSDDGKRRAHDAGGGPGGFSFGGGGGGGEREFTDAFRLFEEMFGGGMFAGGGPPGGGRRRRDVRIHPRETALTLTLTDLFDGGEFRVSAPRTVACAACGGRGGDFSECAACRGEGATNEDVRFGNQIMRTRRPCGACGGAGRALERERRCRTCAGSGAIDEPGHAVVVNLKPGARGGTSVRFAGAGDDVFFSDGALAGRRDLVVVVEEAAHADLQRVGDDLLVARRIPLLDALTGFAIRLPTVASCVESDYRFWGTPRILQNSRSAVKSNSFPRGFLGPSVLAPRVLDDWSEILQQNAPEHSR